MFDGEFRKPFDKAVEPVAKLLHKAHVTPDVLTLFGVLMAAATAVVLARGHFFTGFILLILTGLGDALDGAVAKISGRASIRGAYFDSVVDRLSDALLFFGLGWYYTTTQDPRLAVIPFALYIAASLVSYQRAKAESLGFDAKGGLMERAERFIVLGIGLVFNQILIWVLVAMLVLTVMTALLRFKKVWDQATNAV